MSEPLATDAQTGISIRFIREWKPDPPMPTHVDIVMHASCEWLGHTFVINTDETHCNICGAPNPARAT